MRVSSAIMIALTLLSAFPHRSHAGNPFQPIQTPEALQGPYHRSRFDRGVSHHVKTSRVLVADYELIRTDFPITRHLSNDEIDAWLLKDAGVISKDQIEVGEARGVNSKIQHDPITFKPSIRPPQYGRAFVVEVEGGLLDLKGAGGVAPSIKDATHRNGLMETAEAIREFAYTKLMKRTLEHIGSEFRVIDAYAVIDYGFDVKNTAEHSLKPAGLFVRQAHFREISDHEQLDKKTVHKIERSLREFGITSAYKEALPHHAAEKHLDVLNIQGSEKEKFIFDFGGFRIKDHFKNEAVTLEDWNKVKHDPILTEKGVKLRQPKKEYHPLFEQWGTEGNRERIWEKSREIAEHFKTTGDLSKARAEIDALLRPIEMIPKHPRPQTSLSCLRQTLINLVTEKK